MISIELCFQFNNIQFVSKIIPIAKNHLVTIPKKKKTLLNLTFLIFGISTLTLYY